MDRAKLVRATDEFRRLAEGRVFGAGGRGGTSSQADVVVPMIAAPTAPVATRAPQSILLGRSEHGRDLRVDLAGLLDGRLLVQGASGAGKSWTLRRLFEQSQGLIQQIIIDPEGEFRTLADLHGHTIVEADRLDSAALSVLAGRVRASGISVLVDLSELSRDAQMQSVTAFIEGLIGAPREHWRPALVAIDEAHIFAPYGASSSAPASVRNASIAAVTDLMSRGRKRGLCGVLATQRLARLAKSVLSEAFNFLIGLNTLDLDIRRAAETIGWDARRAFDRLPELPPGDFVASGKAFSMSPTVVTVGPVVSEHRGARPELRAPEVAVDAESALGIDDLVAAAAADTELRGDDAMPPGFREVRALMRDDDFPAMGRIVEALRPLAPEGALIADLASHLGLEPGAVHAALAVLDRYAVVEFSGDGSARAARLTVGMAP